MCVSVDFFFFIFFAPLPIGPWPPPASLSLLSLVGALTLTGQWFLLLVSSIRASLNRRVSF